MDFGSAKVPAIIYASVTNLLVFHTFLEKNQNYRAIMNLDRLVPDPPEPEVPVIAENEVDEDAVVSNEVNPGAGWGFEFTPLTEADVMAGYLVKERLLQLLDHPMLKNHLLKNKNLLPTIVSGPPSQVRVGILIQVGLPICLLNAA
jgi:hypothetical protein